VGSLKLKSLARELVSSRKVVGHLYDIHILGVIVIGTLNELVKKSWVGTLHMLTHIPTQLLLFRYLVSQIHQ
jgi:predicted DNA-binding transcriptional regulator